MQPPILPGSMGCGLPYSDISGQKCRIPTLKGTERIRTIRESSFQVHGPKLFNSLPLFLRKMTKCGVLEFKEKLDNYLTRIPDEPKVGQLYPACCDQVTSNPSNSLVDQIRLCQREARGTTAISAISSKMGL